MIVAALIAPHVWHSWRERRAGKAQTGQTALAEPDRPRKRAAGQGVSRTSAGSFTTTSSASPFPNMTGYVADVAMTEAPAS